MPGEDRIDSIIDIPAVKAEYDQLVKMLDNLVGAIKSAGNADALKNPSIGLKELRTESDKSIKTIQGLSEKILDVVKADEKLIAVTKITLASQAEQVRENKVMSDSYDQLIRQLSKNNMALQTLYNRRADLKKGFEDGKISAENFTESMSKVEKEILSVKYANQELNRSLKNMTKESLSAEGSLNQLRAQLSQALQAYDNLSDADKNSDLGQGMYKNIEALTAAVKKQEEGTGRYGRNVGNYTQAVKILGKELTEITKRIDDLNKGGNQNKDVLEQLVKEQQLLEQLVNNQTTGFASLTAELKENEKALIAMKAAGLENTEMYKQLFVEIAKAKDELGDFKQKMATRGSGELFLNGAIQSAQALVSVYGLAQASTELFGKENEHLQKSMVKLQAVMTILTSLEALQNALKKENAIVTSIEVIKTNALAAAQRLYAFATGGATVATNAFRTALIATGIGAILVLLGTAVNAMTSFGDSTKKTNDQLHDLDKWLDSINEQYELFNKSTERSAKLQSARLKEAFASDQALIKAEIKANQERIKNLDFKLGIDKKKYQTDKLNQEEVEKLNKEITANEQEKKDLLNDISIKETETRKKNFEDYVKLQQSRISVQNSTLGTEAANQQEIASNEKKSFDERIAASREFARLQHEIEANTLKSQLLDPNLKNDPGKKNQLLADSKAKQIEIERKGNQDIQKLTDERIQREKQAQFEIAKVAIQSQMTAAEDIANNESKSIEDRLFAAYEASKARETLIIGQRNLEISTNVYTEEERQAIIEQSNAQIFEEQKALLQRIRDITIQEMQEQEQRDISHNEILRENAIRYLNERFQKGLIGQEQYNRQRAKIEKDYAIKELEIQIESTKDIIEEYKKQGKDIFEIEARLAELQKNLSDQVTQKKLEDIDKVKASLQTIGSDLSAGMGAVSDLFGAFADKQKNAIQDQIEANEKLKAEELDRINKSSLSEQDKANKVAILEATNQAKREALERRQRDIDLKKARFDKARNIMDAITRTAVAVIEGLIKGGPPLAAIYGAIGAVQIAAAVAAPLPKFAKGTESSPEGPAIVGEEGTEMYITPSGKVGFTPDKASLTWLERGTKIIPNDDLNHMIHAGMIRSMARSLEMAQQNNFDKKLDEIKDMLAWQTKELLKGQSRIKAPVVKIEDMSDWKAHIKKNVFD